MYLVNINVYLCVLVQKTLSHLLIMFTSLLSDPDYILSYGRIITELGCVYRHTGISYETFWADTLLARLWPGP